MDKNLKFSDSTTLVYYIKCEISVTNIFYRSIMTFVTKIPITLNPDS